MGPGDDAPRLDRLDSLLRQPVRIPVPALVRRVVDASHRPVVGKVVSVTAGVLGIAVPAALAIVGLVLALAGALLSGPDETEAIGTLGIEVGAAMWFAGAVTLGGRPRPTVLRVALLTVTGFGGLALIGAAIAGGWSGVTLDLAMEFGVGAVAVVVLDIVILGVLQARLDHLATSGPWPSSAPS